jgi:hypothetical protein
VVVVETKGLSPHIIQKNRSNKKMNETKRRHIKGAIDRLAIGLFIFLWGAFLLLQQAGIIQHSVSVWPYALIYFGTLIAVGGIIRLISQTRDKRI